MKFSTEIKRSSHSRYWLILLLAYNGQSITPALWIWIWSDPEDYYRLSIWVPPEMEDDPELMYELARIAAEIWSGEKFPGFELRTDEENGSFLTNRGFTVDREKPAEPRYYSAL